MGTRQPPIVGGARLAVVIPCLDETEGLEGLLRDLAAQRGIDCEVVVVDGGSSDGTAEAAEAHSLTAPFRMTVLRTARGRARQLNAGARASRGRELLFLHADCRIRDPELLARAKAHLSRERERLGHDRVAGHFSLRFRRSEGRPSLAYYYYEAKTALDRRECVNGDQGFWLSRPYFEELGGFDEAPPLLEDARLADRVFATGVWVALPGDVSTSARRFEAEGLLERQTLNALLRSCDALSLPSFFRSAADLYRVQAEAERLDLFPFFRVAHRSVWDGGVCEGLRRWLRAGGYVRSQAWQIAFWFDCRRNFRRHLGPGRGPAPCLDAWDRRRAAQRSPAADALAATLTGGWLYGSLFWTLFRRLLSGPRRRNSG